MFALLDAVALSVWPKARKPKLGRYLRQATGAPGSGPALVEALEYLDVGPAEPLAATLRTEAGKALERAAQAGIVPVPWGDARYPPLLAAIHDPPAVLWVIGQAAALSRPAVALIGSRAASPYGLEAAMRLASDLAADGTVIVSGLARGVDSAAHRGALRAGGVTVAVLGSSPEIVYPPEHAALAAEIAETGAVVSELPPGTEPRALHFPARNRIISGLSLAVVVVEAAEQSGSLITAEFAAEQGREVMAVPGSILAGRHGGCHALIRDGAAIVNSSADIAWELQVSRLRALAGRPGDGPALRHPVLDRMAPAEAYDIDTLARETGLQPAALLPRLLELELRGAVRRVNGSRFVRVG